MNFRYSRPNRTGFKKMPPVTNFFCLGKELFILYPSALNWLLGYKTGSISKV